MATYTDNYQLEKPVASDAGNVAVLNRNSDKIDTILHASQVSIADAYDDTATYNTGDVVMYEFFLYECLDDNVTGTWDSTKWQRTTAATSGSSGGASALTDLTDVAVSSPSNGQVLKYDSTSGKWVNGTGGGGSSTLSGLSDVTITSPTDGQGLVWDATEGKWVNGTSGGSGTTYTVISDTTQTTNAWVNPITISCNPLDYDVIIFDISDSGTGRYYCITFPQTLPLDSGDGDNCKGYVLQGNLMAYPARLSNGMAMFTSTNTTLNVTKVTGIKFGGGSSGGSGISYSTTEQDTGLKWIDGSKIYQITKVYENVAQTSDSNPLTLDTLSDVDTMVRYDVRATTTGGGIINDNFYLDSSYKFHTIYYPDDKSLQYRANWGGSGYFTITITYQYTKTGGNA